MSKFVDILDGINLSPPGVFGLAGVFDADFEAKNINRIILYLNSYYLIEVLNNAYFCYFSVPFTNIHFIVKF